MTSSSQASGADRHTTKLIDWFRHSASYINAHRGHTFVILLGGEALEHDNFGNIVHDIALLNSLGVRLVLVHGSRPQIEQRLQERQLSTRLHHHMRVTDEETLRCVIDAASSNRVKLEAALSMGLANTPMHGARIKVVSGNMVTARPVGVFDGVDLCYTGEVRRVDSIAVSEHLRDGNIVLLSHLGYSPTGEVFNLAAEDVAAQAAISLKADKLLLYGEDKGVIDSHGQMRSELLARTAERLLSQYFNRIDDAETPYAELACNLSTAVTACKGGVPRSHLISYLEDGSLLQELFSREGTGTMVVQESYEQLRDATIDDVGGILELIQPLEANGTLVRRSRERLEAEIERFLVIDRDSAIVGCAALYPYEEDAMGELACVAIDRNYRGGNKGDQLLDGVEDKARELGLDRLFVLTTRTAHWFLERGFKPSPVGELPQEKRDLYNFQRNSKVFIKTLD